jgi:CheY-like chemotaxis protein
LRSAPTGTKRLVVQIEDNPANIAFMESFFADIEGVDLLTAPTAEIGLELARAHHPDVILMDVNLPGMDGIEATRRLKTWPETSAIPVIGLSAAAMIRDTRRARDAGFHRYLTKPVDVDELTAVLEELFAQSHQPT